VEIKAPESFWGSTIGQLDIRKKYRIEIVALKKYIVSKLGSEETLDESQTRVIPSADEKINAGDALVVIGTNEDIEKMRSQERE
jgi:trk system potassium uptake protein TrkA